MKRTMEQFASMTEQKTDQDLVAACRSGSSEAFESLYAQNQKRVFSVALNFFGGDEASAGDVTQQVFLKIFRRIESFRGEAELTTWLYRITVNTCIDEQRRRRRFLSLNDLFGFWPASPRRTPDEKLHRREICHEVQKALTALKPKFRLPLVLRYVEGLSYDEIAAVLECSKGTVASRLNRGHKMLARELKHLKDQL